MYNYNNFSDTQNNDIHTYCKSENIDLLNMLAHEKETRKANRRCFFKLIAALIGKAKRKEIDEDFLANAQSMLSL